MDLSPDELMAALRTEIIRVHGKNYAEKCLIFYRGGRFFYSAPRKHSRGKLEVEPITKPLLRRDIVKILDELKLQKSKKRFGIF